MAKGIIRTKAKTKNGSTSVKIMAKHVMETGNRKDKKGNKIPAQYIQSMTVDYNGKRVMEAYMGTPVSKNPYLAFTFEGGAKGDQLAITWTENTGQSAVENAKIK